MNSRSVTVLKFGSSFLKTPQNLTNAVQEIYSVYRRGQKVVAVVSAMGNTTDSLIRQASEVHPEPERDPHSYAELLASGETHASFLLNLALQASGVNSSCLGPRELGIQTEGDPLNAEPVLLQSQNIEQALERHAVVVVPGFVGLSTDGKINLLGRGGSDLTAVFLAHHLKAVECILLKDVDGLYDSDPHLHSTARRFESITWSKAIRIGGRIVQRKCLAFAEAHGLRVRVTSHVHVGGTIIGPGEEKYDIQKSSAKPPRRVLLLGLGTVGRGVFEELLRRPSEFEVRGILVRDVQRHAQSGIPDHLLLRDVDQIWNESEYDLVIELIGGTDLALRLIEQALSLGIDVVSANKTLMATQGPNFEQLAAKNRARILYSAAVGGSIPVLETIEHLEESLVGGENIKSITGVVNGTCNFILDQMMDGSEFQTAVRKAQDLGFAEADPTQDISGADAAQKLSLLIKRAFKQETDWRQFNRIGIEELDEEKVRNLKRKAKTVRLVARCELRENQILAEIAPQILPQSHPFAQVHNEENIFLIETNLGNTYRLTGKGAGRTPTARSVLSDVLHLSQNSRREGSAPRFNH